MPIHPTEHLLTVGASLRAISGKLPEGKELSWSQYQTFCAIHAAETSVIPLGVRDGFGVTVDFLKVPERLVLGWIGEELAALVDDPKKSPIFCNILKDIGEMGKWRWSGLNNQTSIRTMSLTKPG